MNEVADVDQAQADVAMGISSFLRTELANKGVTQLEVSMRSGMHFNTINRILNDTPSKINTLVRIADALGYRVNVTFEAK